MHSLNASAVFFVLINITFSIFIFAEFFTTNKLGPLLLSPSPFDSVLEVRMAYLCIALLMTVEVIVVLTCTAVLLCVMRTAALTVRDEECSTENIREISAFSEGFHGYTTQNISNISKITEALEHYNEQVEQSMNRLQGRPFVVPCTAGAPYEFSEGGDEAILRDLIIQKPAGKGSWIEEDQGEVEPDGPAITLSFCQRESDSCSSSSMTELEGESLSTICVSEGSDVTSTNCPPTADVKVVRSTVSRYRANSYYQALSLAFSLSFVLTLLLACYLFSLVTLSSLKSKLGHTLLRVNSITQRLGNSSLPEDTWTGLTSSFSCRVAANYTSCFADINKTRLTNHTQDCEKEILQDSSKDKNGPTCSWALGRWLWRRRVTVIIRLVFSVLSYTISMCLFAQKLIIATKNTYSQTYPRVKWWCATDGDKAISRFQDKGLQCQVKQEQSTK